MHNIVRSNFTFQTLQLQHFNCKVIYNNIVHFVGVFLGKNSFVRSKIWAVDYKYENPKIMLDVT